MFLDDTLLLHPRQAETQLDNWRLLYMLLYIIYVHIIGMPVKIQTTAELAHTIEFAVQLE